MSTGGQDTHLKIFVGDTASVTFKPPLSLMSPLTPNAGHNITVKYRDGQALAYVDDTDIGYVVTVTSGTGEGSLAYGLTNNVGQYVIFAAATDNQSIVISEMTLQRTVRNIIGNGKNTTKIVIENDGEILLNVDANNGGSLTFQNLDFHGCVRRPEVDSNRHHFEMRDCLVTGMTAAYSDDYRNGGYIGGLYSWVSGSTFSNNKNAYGAITSPVQVKDCLFENNTFTTTVVQGCIQAYNTKFINNTVTNGLLTYSNSRSWSNIVDGCLFDQTDVEVSKRGTALVMWRSWVTVKDSRFLNVPQAAAVYGYDAKMAIQGTVKLTGSTIGLTKSSSGDTDLPMLAIEPSAVIDLSDLTGDYAIVSNDPDNLIFVGTFTNNTTPTVSGTAYAIPYGGGEPFELSGTGNKMLTNGRFGYEVTSTNATGTGSLYDAINVSGTTYTNFIFSHSLDESTINTPDDSWAIPNQRNVSIYGNGVDKTIIKGLGVSNSAGGDVILKDLTCIITTHNFHSSGGGSSGMGSGLFDFTNVKFEGPFTYGGSSSVVDSYEPIRMKNVVFDDITSTSTLSNRWLVKIVRGGGALKQNKIMSNCTFGPNIVSGLGAISIGISTTYTLDFYIVDCSFLCPSALIKVVQTQTLYMEGTNIVNTTISTEGTVVLQDQSVLDLSGNTNSTVISGGGTITVESGSTVTIKPYGGGADVTLTGPTVGTTLSNLGVLSGTPS